MLTDFERLVACIPGAALTSHDGESYGGELTAVALAERCRTSWESVGRHSETWRFAVAATGAFVFGPALGRALRRAG